MDSKNKVNCNDTAAVIKGHGARIRICKNPRLAVVGDATAFAVQNHGGSALVLLKPQTATSR